METDKANEAIEHLEQSAAIQTNMPKNIQTYLTLSKIFHLLGQRSIKLHKLETSQKYFKKALQIQNQTTKTAETDISLAATLHELGRFFAKYESTQ